MTCELAEIAVYDKRERNFVMVTRQVAIDGIMRRAGTMRPGEPARAVVEATALALARYGPVDALAVANMWDPPADTRPSSCPNCYGEREWSGDGRASCYFCGQTS